MKRLIVITIAAVMILGIVFLTGCGGNDVIDDASDAMTKESTVDSGNDGSGLMDEITDMSESDTFGEPTDDTSTQNTTDDSTSGNTDVSDETTVSNNG